MNNQVLVRDALSALLHRTNEDAFVIFEDRQTRKFVQFAGSASESLLLDLPAQALNEEEFDRAGDYFHHLGIMGDPHALFDRPGGSVVGEQFSFNIVFRSVDEAARVAIGVFETVYQLPPDFTLDVTEN